MDAARVTAIAEGITVQARTAVEGPVPAGAWRDIANNDVVNHREELMVESDGVRYAFTACTLQKRVAGVWTDALNLTLDVAEGTSHFRQDRLSVGGDETNSTVSVLTIDKGQPEMRETLRELKRQAKTRFTLDDSETRFRGISTEIELANRAQMGGFAQDFNGVIVAEREQFVTAGVAPARGGKITVAGNTFRITSVKVDDVSYLVEFESVNR